MNHCTETWAPGASRKRQSHSQPDPDQRVSKDRHTAGGVPGNLTVDEHIQPEKGSKGKWNPVETMQYIFIGQPAKQFLFSNR